MAWEITEWSVHQIIFEREFRGNVDTASSLKRGNAEDNDKTERVMWL